MLISETHFTDKYYLSIPGYLIYTSQHPDGTAHGGTAIVIRNNIKHYELQKYNYDYLQSTTLKINDIFGPIIVASIYCPPKHSITEQMFHTFFPTHPHGKSTLWTY